MRHLSSVHVHASNVNVCIFPGNLDVEVYQNANTSSPEPVVGKHCAQAELFCVLISTQSDCFVFVD